MAMRRLLITGASGLLGAHLVATARQRGFEVFAASRSWCIRVPGVHSTTRAMDDAAACRELIARCRPDAVVHCAAWTDVDACEIALERAMHVNGAVPGFLAEAARRSARTFVYISTDSVFDGSTGSYTEGDAPNPINVYARSKLHGESAVQAAWDEALIVRTNLFGWNAQPKKSLAEWVLAKLRGGETVPGFQDVYFNPLEAGELASVTLGLVEKKACGIVHVGASDSCSKYQFARMTADVFDLNAQRVLPALSSDVSFRASRPLNTTMNVGHVEALLGRRMKTVREGLIEMQRQEEQGDRQRLTSSVEKVEI